MNILHLQTPYINNNKLLFDPVLMGKFMKLAQDILGDEYKVIASPYIPSLLSRNDVIYNFNMKQITLEELKEMLNE